MAWAYTAYQTDPAFPQAERAARASRAGLWSDPKAPTPPWQWRRESKGFAATAAGPMGGGAVAAATGLTRKPSARPAASGGTCHVGPRGGTYTIGRGGRKNYAGC